MSESSTAIEVDDNSADEAVEEQTVVKAGHRSVSEVWSIAFGISETVATIKVAKQSLCLHCERIVKHNGKSEVVANRLRLKCHTYLKKCARAQNAVVLGFMEKLINNKVQTSLQANGFGIPVLSSSEQSKFDELMAAHRQFISEN
jgi:hypothetical protein